jgi:hypothetical protein
MQNLAFFAYFWKCLGFYSFAMILLETMKSRHHRTNKQPHLRDSWNFFLTPSRELELDWNRCIAQRVGVCSRFRI